MRVKRYKRCIIYYKDLEWNDCSMELEGDMSELIQHEYDHLDGILATLRGIKVLLILRGQKVHFYVVFLHFCDFTVSNRVIYAGRK